MSEDEHKRGNNGDLFRTVDDYDRLIEAFSHLSQPEYEGRMRRLKEELGKVPAPSSNELQEALEALETEAPDGSRPAVEAARARVRVPDPAPPAPPHAGEVLVGLFCRRELREAVLGDLDEKFAELAGRRGARVARAWYWSQAARSALFFALRWGRRLLELEAILRRVF